VAVALLAAPAVRVYRVDALRQDFRSAALWMDTTYRSGDGLINLSVSSASAMDYYMHYYPGRPRLFADALGVFSYRDYPQEADPRTPINTAVLIAFGTRHPRIFLIDSSLDAGNPKAARDAAVTMAWMKGYYHPVSGIKSSAYYGSVTVRLYARNA